MSNENCFFCKLANKEVATEIIFENDDAVVILDKFPAVLGHLLVIPKKHASDIFDADDETVAGVYKVVSKVAKALKKLNFNDMNILQNNGLAAGQTMFHLHVHIIPRYENDNINIKWQNISPDEKELPDLIGRLRSAICGDDDCHSNTI